MTSAAKHTYGQILRSSAWIGASSVLDIGFRIVRTKAMALLLGPAGVGLLGLYTSIAELAQSVAGMGVNSSGVRQIAQAVGSGDEQRIARTITVVRRTSVVLGALGAAFLVLYSRQVATLTFGGAEHGVSVALLSIAVFLRLVAAAQGAVLQGMRRIADLARMAAWGAFSGTVISIPLVYLYGEAGIVPSIIGTAATTLVTAWWYSRQVRIELVALTRPQVANEASALLKLGFAFMTSGMMAMGAAWAVRVIVLREVGTEAAGLYHAAWVIGGLYVGFILQAMGTDFYPRLTAVADDDAECRRLVNEQAQVSMLLAGPGVLATLTLTPIIIVVLYSNRFDGAVETLRWICLGMSLRVITWPMGFIIVARGMQTLFVAVDLACGLVQVGLAWLLVRYFGLEGAGMAFLGMYVFHALLIYPVVRRVSGFRWSPANLRVGLLLIPLIAAVFYGFRVLPIGWAIGLGMAAMLASGVYSLRVLASLVSLDRLPRSTRQLLALLRLVPPSD